MNYELIRRKLIEIYEEYLNDKTKKDSLTKMKEIVKEYDDVIEVLEETLNCSFGIMEAIVKGDVRDKKEETALVNEILKELNSKDYLAV